MSAPATPSSSVAPRCAWCLQRHTIGQCPHFHAFHKGVDAMPPLDQCAEIPPAEVRRA